MTNQFKFSLFILMMFNAVFIANGQQTEQWRITIGSGVEQTYIKSENIENDKYFRTEKKIMPRLSLEISSRLAKGVYFHSGFQYTQFRTVAFSKGWFKESLSVDINNYYYYPVYETDFEVEKTIKSISLPIALRFLSNPDKPVRFIFEGGFKVTFPTEEEIKIKGRYFQRSLYPDAQYFNVLHLIENGIPQGVPSSPFTKTKGVLMMAYGSTGFESAISQRLGIFTKLSYQVSIGDISEKKVKSKKYIDPGGMETEYRKTNLKAMGFEIGMLITL